MKKFFALSLLIPFALACSCQKQDSTAEQELSQRKTELDAREKAVEEKEKAVLQREKVVGKPKVAPVSRSTPAEPQRTIPPELSGLMADPSQGREQREQRMQERFAERQRKMEELQKTRAARALPRAPRARSSRPSRRLLQTKRALVTCGSPKSSADAPTAWQARARTGACRWNRHFYPAELP